MNIHQLLSVSQGSPQTQSPGAFNRQDPVNGLFHQALLQASDTSSLSASRFSEISASQAPQEQTKLNALSSLVSAGLEVDVENLSAALVTLGLDIRESDFSELLAQLQLPNSDISADTLGLNGGQASSYLDEIADRLALMASFSDGNTSLTAEQLADSGSLQLIAEQLNTSQTDAAQLVDTPALKTSVQHLSPDNDQPTLAVEPVVLGAVAEQLNISQTDAAQLVNTSIIKTIAQYLSRNNSELALAIDPVAMEATIEQLNISQTDAAQLVDTSTLKTIVQYLSPDNSQPTLAIEPVLLETIAEQLNINQTDAAQLVDTSTLKTIVQYLSPDNDESARPTDPIALGVIADQLSTNQTEAAQLVDTPELKTIIQSLSVDMSGSVASIDPAALEAIAGLLNINQTQTAQMVSTLNSLITQQQNNQTLPFNSARITDARQPVVELQAAPRPQPDTFVAQINTVSASPQISSEALAGALLTLEGSTKGNPTGEHLLSGLSLSAGSPAASSQSVQALAPAVTPTAATLATPVTSPAWSQQLGQQLVQISKRGGEQHVQMQLNPAELGPLSISLKFGEQGAQAHFLSAHAQVRQVLEQAIPQLREALAEQGISLGDTSVGEQRAPNDQAFAQSSGKQGTRAGGESGEIGSDDPLPQNTESGSLTLDGRVDLYA
ncbi:MAG: flagellar hook-length control protein FliK [Halomonas sp.]|nr:flagellar hook-length control protein FliK [Halomonas sp.]MBL1270116.1 flagellar hook-length control protein FliK [Halomonas sp.]